MDLMATVASSLHEMALKQPSLYIPPLKARTNRKDWMAYKIRDNFSKLNWPKDGQFFPVSYICGFKKV